MNKIITIFSLIVASLLHAESDYQFRGKHFIANYTECDEAALRDVQGLIDAMHLGVKKSGATVLSDSTYHFPGDGLTMAILLSESHATIHTYPEHQACFVDLFTCGDHCHYAPFDQALRDFLKPKAVQSKVLIRDEAFKDHN